MAAASKSTNGTKNPPATSSQFKLKLPNSQVPKEGNNNHTEIEIKDMAFEF